MLKIEKFVTASPEQMEMIIEGMRNPMNSWDRMDSGYIDCDDFDGCAGCPRAGLGYCADTFNVGPNDHQLMMSLAKGGPVHAKYRRMMPIFVTITAPLYWWKEFDTYKVGTVANSCSTMHKIHAKEFTIDDFSTDHLMDGAKETIYHIIDRLNYWRKKFLEITEKLKYATTTDETKVLSDTQKKYWWQMIQLLPTSYNQTRTVLLNYEVAHAMRKDRRFHKLDEWHVLCDFFESLPYSEIITMEE